MYNQKIGGGGRGVKILGFMFFGVGNLKKIKNKKFVKNKNKQKLDLDNSAT